MNKCYYRIVWENYPSDKTPLNEQNLNKIDVATDEMDNRVIVLDTTKFDKSEAQLLIKDMTLDIQTGILTKYYYNGSTEEINTGISKLNMNLRFDAEDQILYIVNADGTEDPVDLSIFITNYEFEDSDTIAHNVSGGKVKSIVKEGSIQEKHLQPNYLADIKVEVAKAQASQEAAAESEKNAKDSENATKASETAAKTSETNAAASATNSENSATLAGQKAAAAANSAAAAKASEENAEAAKDAAAESEINAKGSEDASEASATSAAGSASTATEKASEAENYADLSKSYAKGTGGTVRENDDSDNAEYFYEQTKRISQSFSGVVPMGTITFEDLDNPDNQQPGYMFNISDSFVSDERFQDGGGIFYGAGNNVLYTADGKWDVLAAAMVSGVKGNAENEYRQGFVNLTPGNIGAFPGVIDVNWPGSSMDDFTSDGFWQFHSGANAPIDAPGNSVNGWLMVISGSSTAFGKQIFFRYGSANTTDYMTYVRTHMGAGWSDWKRFAMGDDVAIATTSKAGIVKPDGKTIKVDTNGTIVGAASGFTGTKAEVQQAIDDGSIKEGMIVNITDDYDAADAYDSELSQTSENAVQNKVVTAAITAAYNLAAQAMPYNGDLVYYTAYSNQTPIKIPAGSPAPWDPPGTTGVGFVRYYLNLTIPNKIIYSGFLSVNSYANDAKQVLNVGDTAEALVRIYQKTPSGLLLSKMEQKSIFYEQSTLVDHIGYGSTYYYAPLSPGQAWVEFEAYDIITGNYVSPNNVSNNYTARFLVPREGN